MYRIPASQAILKMSSKNKPVLCVEAGSSVVFETRDCFSNHIQNESQLFSSVGWDLINPATGPLFINEAEPGDILKIEVLEIKIAAQGVMTTAPGFGVLAEQVAEKTKIIPIQGHKAIFNEKISVPVRPMIGVIGTAPQEEDILTGTPGSHGGNMDCKRITRGAVLYLPVNVPGALLAVGDLHAVMGDGEIIVCGVEIAGEVMLRVDVLKGERLPLPMLLEGDAIMTIASSKTLDEAARLATKNMHEFLCAKLGLSCEEAGMLLSICGDLKICQVVDPLMTARMELPRWILEKYDYQMR